MTDRAMLYYKLPLADRQMALRFQLQLSAMDKVAMVTPDNTLYIESDKEVRANGIIQLSKDAFENELWEHLREQDAKMAS